MMLLTLALWVYVFTPDSTGGTTQEWLWAVDWGDSAVVLVEDGRAGFGFTDMRLVWLDLAAWSASPDQAVNDTALLRQRTEPRIAGDGTALLAAWSEALPGGGARIMGRRLRGTVGPATASPLLPMDPSVAQSSPALAYASGSSTYLVLAVADSALYTDLWFRLMDPADTGSVHALDPQHSTPRYAPDAAWMPAAQAFAVVWETYGPTWNSEIHFSRIFLNGTVDTLRLVAGDTSLDASAPDVAAGASDTVGLVYRWLNGTASGIHLLLLDTTGRALGPPIPVNTDAGSAYRTPPHLSVTPTGWAVTWADDRDGVLRVYLRTFARDGTPEGPEQAVYPAGWPSEHPFAFATLSGPVVVAEVYRPSGEEDILAARTATGDTLNLIQDDGTGDQQDLAGIPWPSGALVAWSDQGSPAQPRVYLRVLGPSAPLSDPLLLGIGTAPALAADTPWLWAAWDLPDTAGNTRLQVAWLDPSSLTRDTSRSLWDNPGEWALSGLQGDTALLAVVHQGRSLLSLRVARTGPVDTFLLNDTTLWAYPAQPRWRSCHGLRHLYWKSFVGTRDMLFRTAFGPDGTPDTVQDTVALFPAGLYAYDVACADTGLWIVTDEPTGVQVYRRRPGGVDTLPLGVYHSPVIAAHPTLPRVAVVALLASSGGRDRVMWALVRPDTVWGPFPVDTPAVEVMQGEPHVLADTAGFWVLYTSNEQRRGVNGRARFFPWPAWVGQEEFPAPFSRLSLVYLPRLRRIQVSPGETADLQLLDLLGRRVAAHRLPASAEPRGWTLPRSLPSGIYVVLLSTARERRTLKLMLERTRR